jgi:2-polyprenyl-3-methyl-5-hydroxy-6-metoxy-1,4-benzoquinol methylase
MDLSQIYNDAYSPYSSSRINLEMRDRVEKETRGFLQLVDEIKSRFLPDKAWSEMRVAELGCGMAGLSLQLARRGAQVVAVDFAPRALEIARELASMSHLSIETVCLDVSKPDATLDQKFDLIIDSHLLHCLALDPDRASYLSFVKEHLKPDGFFVGETMVHRKKMYIPNGYKLDEKNILYQKFADWTPVRKIIDSLDLEVEFKSSGLYINYFYYYGNFSFAPSEDFWEIPAEILPASVRFALRLS